MLLVHGLPEFWRSWRHQMEALAHASYCAVAVDQRGYEASSNGSLNPPIAEIEGGLRGWLRSI